MFRFGFRKREYGMAAFALGLGIFLTILLPPWGWMIGCALGLIISGVILFKSNL